jgi:hypothetical protein
MATFPRRHSNSPFKHGERGMRRRELPETASEPLFLFDCDLLTRDRG